MIDRFRRIVASPFVALYSGVSTARDIVLIAMAIAQAGTGHDGKPVLDGQTLRFFAGFRGKSPRKARQARRVNPNRAAQLQRQAEKAKSSGDLKKAIGLYSEALHDVPYNAALYFLRGNALLQANRPQEAAKDFVAGLQLDPDNQTLTFLMHTANAMAAANANSQAIVLADTLALRPRGILNFRRL